LKNLVNKEGNRMTKGKGIGFQAGDAWKQDMEALGFVVKETTTNKSLYGIIADHGDQLVGLQLVDSNDGHGYSTWYMAIDPEL